MTLTEKTAYIKGLAEGLGIKEEDSAQAKLILALIDLCEEMTEEIENINSDIEDLTDYVEELDEDLGEVERFMLDLDEDCDCGCCCDDDDCDCDCDDDDFECSCGCCDDDGQLGFDDDMFEDEEYYEIVCPSCGDTVCFDATVCVDTLKCPACNSPLVTELTEDDEDEE